MAGIRCAGCDQEAVAGFMVYGPEGGTTDMCPTHLAEWALGYALEAYPQLRDAYTQAAETPQEAPDGSGSTGGRRKRTRRQEAAQETPQEPVADQVQDAEVERAEH